MYLETYKAELETLGFSIARESECEIVAVSSRWYWSRLAIKLSTVVFLRATGPLSADNIESERERMRLEAAAVDPSALPLGFQKGRIVMPFYVADDVLPDAQAMCSSEQPMRWAQIYFPVALNRSTGASYYLRTTPIIGSMLYTTPHFIARRLLEPGLAPQREPLSRVAVAMNAMFLLMGAFFVLFLGYVVYVLAHVL